jgi:hypothetical protein
MAVVIALFPGADTTISAAPIYQAPAMLRKLNFMALRTNISSLFIRR